MLQLQRDSQLKKMADCSRTLSIWKRGGEDWGEAKPIGGFTLENESEDIYSNQIWHD